MPYLVYSYTQLAVLHDCTMRSILLVRGNLRKIVSASACRQMHVGTALCGAVFFLQYGTAVRDQVTLLRRSMAVPVAVPNRLVPFKQCVVIGSNK